ncbi:MAG: hypothetical protein Q9191_000008 [Dirinaria sp. TL-2023a]
MPNDADSPRSGSRKGRKKPSSQGKAKELEAANDLDTDANVSNEAENAALKLASYSKALQRVADIAYLLQSKSCLSDIDTVEQNHEGEVDRENEIRRLRTVVAELTYGKSEELEKMRTEIARLKDGEEACRRERADCQRVQEDVKAQKARADAERKQEYEKKLQEDKIKAQKRMDAKKAEIEADFNKKVRDFEDGRKTLVAENQRLKEDIAQLQENAQNKKIKHKREMQGLDSELERTVLELKQIKSDFPNEWKPLEYFSHRFREIFTHAKIISAKYFQKLPELAGNAPSDTQDMEALQKALNERSPMFESVSLLQTESADFVRSQIARSVISNCICTQIWQPFLTEGSFSEHQTLDRFLEKLSQKLLSLGGRGESAWRILTLRAIDALSKPLGESPKTKSIVGQIIGTLRPLVAPGDLAQLEEDLTGMISDAMTTWQAARVDEKRFIVRMDPNTYDKEMWYAEDIQLPREGSSLNEWPAATTKEPMCLFPNIVQTTCEGETVIISQGSALFPNSNAWNKALLEKKSQDLELNRAVEAAVSKVYARRPSYPNGPNSNMAGKGSIYADMQKFQFE